MKIERTGRFEKAYRRLSHQDQERVDTAIRLFMTNPLSPSLHVEKISGTTAKWSFRASPRVRCTFYFTGDLQDLNDPDALISLSNAGGHKVYRSP